MTVSGQEAINQNNDNLVWETLFKILELRMRNGEFTVIDATNSKTSEINRYKDLCSEYKYRMYCVDFTDVPIEVAKERNRNREEMKRVPDEVIDKVYSRFETQKIPSGVTVIKPNELDKIWIKMLDMSEFKKVHVIGDIHGCNTALHEYLDSVGGIKDDELYIFCGDYVDRGIENAGVVQTLLSIYERKNVWLLEGNHEQWLWAWANDRIAKSKEFELVTKTELDNAGIDKKAMRQLYRRLGQCAYFKYHGNVYMVTHAGLSNVPENLTTLATIQMIKGVGNYNDYIEVSESFVRNTPSNYYQIYGHRNTKRLPTKINERCFNLEGNIERGEQLRCVQLTPDGAQNVVEITNTVFRKYDDTISNVERATAQTVGDKIIEMRRNKYIREKHFGNISSFNFTKDAFYDKVWDGITTKARGLYINIPKAEVVARAYDKFFNVNERPETKLEALADKLAFPVTAYVKENGFLGIVSYNDEDDSLFVTTKSDPEGEFADWFRSILNEKVEEATRNKIKEFAKVNNVSLVFECVDMKHDPHVIEYPDDTLYLLDIVYNDLNFRKYDFADLCRVADTFGLRHKEKAFVIDDWQTFYDWYRNVLDSDYLYNGRRIEGFVVEDYNGYMVKLKLAYYNLWKFLRSIAREAIKKGYIDSPRTSKLVTPLENQFYGWARTLHDREDVDELPKDICSLRKMFFRTDVGMPFAD